MTTGTQWHVEDSRYVVDEEDVLIADCYADTHLELSVPDLGDVAKNAKLIAAAPDLLAACEIMLRDHLAAIYMQPEEVKGGIAKQAMDAIRKAKGSV